MRFFDEIKLRIFIKLHTNLYNRINFLSRKLNKNIHPKHRIMKYHQFFLDNIEKASKVLDIGCGQGLVAYELANKAKIVIACDISKKKLKIAKTKFKRDNITYIFCDATKFNFDETFDYVILSNVLEHIKDRVIFLNRIKSLAKILLIRVPMINRSWLVLYKKELGLEYKLDPSHYIEYTFETLQNELKSVGLTIRSHTIQFGEIWAIAEKII